jgi:uncharacterized protein (DUF1800 family)
MADNKIDPSWAWQPYQPTGEAPWNIQRVGHLYRRMTFGATTAQLETGLADGPDKTIDSIFYGGSGQADFNRSTAALAESIAKSNNGPYARSWWLYRMLYCPYPFQEKMTLFWHNHFATSNAKVQNARFMLDQYELMRQHALGHFPALLQGMSKDGAMLIWLDGRDSKKGNPNENYARELMELFSLGLGHYTEKDIREAARAFTGWEIKGTQVSFNKKEHDASDKTVLGQTGKWTGADIVRICLEQPAAPRFLVGKLYRFLISEQLHPTPELLEPLAQQFKTSHYDIGELVRTMISSNLFFSPLVYRTRMKAPVDFALGIVRALEGRHIGTTALGAALEQLGQNVFSPPSVKGWDGGPTWLNGQTLLFRQNLALALTSTEDIRFGARLDPAKTAEKYGKTGDEELVHFFLRLFLQEDAAEESKMRLLAYQKKAKTRAVPVYWTDEDAANHRVRVLCHLVLSLPEFQLD